MSIFQNLQRGSLLMLRIFTIFFISIIPFCAFSQSDKIERAKAEVQRQIDAGLIQGAVFIATDVPATAMGYQCVSPTKKTMTINSRFDIASVGKIFTASLCALLVCDGTINPDAPFTKYLPESALGKDNDITVRDLSMHVSGFNNIKPYISKDMNVFHRELFNKRPVRPRLTKYEYSCTNFILLGKLVNKLTGEDLDTCAKSHIWQPLGMTRTTWNPPGGGEDEVEHYFPHRPAGQHNDPACFNCPFPIGSGSCFSTAQDMMLFANDLLQRKKFPKQYYDLLFTPVFEKNGIRRSFGWDMSDNGRPAGLSNKTILHTGWTGQTICIDPENNFAAVVLTSRTGDHKKAREGREKIISILFGK